MDTLLNKKLTRIVAFGETLPRLNSVYKGAIALIAKRVEELGTLNFNEVSELIIKSGKFENPQIAGLMTQFEHDNYVRGLTKEETDFMCSYRDIYSRKDGCSFAYVLADCPKGMDSSWLAARLTRACDERLHPLIKSPPRILYSSGYEKKEPEKALNFPCHSTVKLVNGELHGQVQKVHHHGDYGRGRIKYRDIENLHCFAFDFSNSSYQGDKIVTANCSMCPEIINEIMIENVHKRYEQRYEQRYGAKTQNQAGKEI